MAIDDMVIRPRSWPAWHLGHERFRTEFIPAIVINEMAARKRR